jgi:hypothetical protein
MIRLVCGVFRRASLVHPGCIRLPGAGVPTQGAPLWGGTHSARSTALGSEIQRAHFQGRQAISRSSYYTHLLLEAANRHNKLRPPPDPKRPTCRRRVDSLTTRVPFWGFATGASFFAMAHASGLFGVEAPVVKTKKPVFCSLSFLMPLLPFLPLRPSLVFVCAAHVWGAGRPLAFFFASASASFSI